LFFVFLALCILLLVLALLAVDRLKR
jgi:heme exporter protein D